MYFRFKFIQQLWQRETFLMFKTVNNLKGFFPAKMVINHYDDYTTKHF